MAEINAEIATRIKQAEAIVLGCSAGGFQLIYDLVPLLHSDFPLPILIVIHRGKNSKSALDKLLQQHTTIRIKDAEDKEPILPGTVYFAPPDYHLLVEPEKVLSLDASEPVMYCRPAIDLLFETASEVYKEKLVGILLSGANTDGANGLKTISAWQGITVVQDPDDAEINIMPQAALNLIAPDLLIKANTLHLLFDNIYKLQKTKPL